MSLVAIKNIGPEVLQDLKQKLKCQVVIKSEASDEEYHAAIDRWNKAYIRKAEIVVFPESEGDVSSSILFVKDWGLDLAISCGRHSYHGASSTNGIVIDLRKMNKVSVDKSAMTLTAQGGCLAEALDTAGEKEGLSVVMGAVNETGIGGLTTGGGTGALTGQYGHIVDNLVSARVVLADGTAVVASKDINSDLFWAIRGGGSNFGICTEFTYKAYYQGPVVIGFLKYSADKLQSCLEATNSLQTKAVEGSSGKFQAFLIITNTLEDQRFSPTYFIFYDGTETEACHLVAPLIDIGPVFSSINVHPYSTVNNIHRTVPQTTRCQRYALTTVEMGFPLNIPVLNSSLDEFKKFKAQFGNAASPSEVVIELRSSLITSSIPISATAYANRRKSSAVAFKMQYETADLDMPMREGLRQLATNIRELGGDGSDTNPQVGGSKEVLVNANYSSGDEKLKAVFGENLPRLIELKRKFDPDCMFNKWYPIPVVDA